jgi:DNA-binding transcriptional ArsR family regulator
MSVRRRAPRPTDPDIAEVAALIGDPARAAMLLALLDGGELPATELAFRAGVSAQAASAHLAKLARAHFIEARSLGRQRLFRVTSAEVAHAMEALAALARPVQIVALSQNAAIQRLRQARSCYDHLAGRLGVAITDYLLEKKALAKSGDAMRIGRSGERFFRKLGIDLELAMQTRRRFARPCLDWTERRHHLAGSLGKSVLDFLLADGWLTRNAHDRALHVTPRGSLEFKRRFRIDASAP